MAVEVEDVIGMGHATTTGILREAHRRGLCEEGGISRTLACLGLQADPGVGRPGKTHITEGIAKAVPSLIIIVARIDLQGLVCPVAEDTLDGLLVVFCRHIAWCEKGTLIAVGHHNHGYIIILATLVETVLVVGDHIAIDTRPETCEAHVAVTERHGVHLPQLLEVLFLQVLLEGQTLLLSTLLRGVHTQRTGLVAPWGERAATLTDAGTEETLCQG